MSKGGYKMKSCPICKERMLSEDKYFYCKDADCNYVVFKKKNYQEEVK